MVTEQQKKKNAALPLPPDLIEEILLRLPMKSLVRFRSVSKQCLSLTTDPQFARSNFDLCGAAPINGLLYMKHSGSVKAGWVDVDKSIHRYHVVRLPVPYHSDELPAMIGSCRGFVLLHDVTMHGWSFILWNPLTGVHKKLSYHLSTLRKGSLSIISGSRLIWCGFGYDESSDDYLVVIGWEEGYTFRTRWEFFSVRTNSWKEIATTTKFPHVINIERQCGVFLNGAIHWLATIIHGLSQSKVIIAFDLADKSISEISLPNLDSQEGDFGDLMVLVGCLGVSFRKGHKTKIWVMKEYRVHSTWTKYYSVFHTGAIVPICFTKGGELVAKEDRRRLVKFKDNGILIYFTKGDELVAKVKDLRRLVKFNDKGIVVERQRYYHFRRDNHAREVMFTPTLLSLPGDVEE